MKKRSLALLFAFVLVMIASEARAVICLTYCCGTPGNPQCCGPAPEGTGCSAWWDGGGGGCFMGSYQQCGGDPGCGFNGNYCGPDQH